MEKKILIDSLGVQETRVVVTTDGVVEDFYIETQNERSLKGNIYLAKVARIEPALQAAFVDYGDDQHGFLPFGEIHPNYFRIPVEDREALYAEENDLNEEADSEQESDEQASYLENQDEESIGDDGVASEHKELVAGEEEPAKTDVVGNSADEQDEDTDKLFTDSFDEEREQPSDEQNISVSDEPKDSKKATTKREELPPQNEEPVLEQDEEQEETREIDSNFASTSRYPRNFKGKSNRRNWSYKRRRQNSSRRLYRIQEVIKKNQIILVQVTKERRGNKGVSLSSYIALASRYCVFMANSTRGGGVSRKIGTQKERTNLKNLLEEMQIPKGQSLILRTAGASRTKEELKKDYGDILGVWNDIRTKTMEANAPCMIHEEASLAKRLVRDFYDEDVKEILISGDQFYKEVRESMGVVLSQHKRRVKKYKGDDPIFQAFGVEEALDSVFSPKVFLPSGGYIILTQTEALVSIDVNSGRATRERSIDDTAVRTNLEAVEEISRQLRLRDLAGLIVIDFIDMLNVWDRQAVEDKMRAFSVKDRARIQIGSISNFGLLEMSRQRLRSSLNELGTEKCLHCQGAGYVMSKAMLSHRALRLLEAYFIGIGRETLSEFDKLPTVSIKVPMGLSTRLLNEHRRDISNLEDRYRVRVRVKEWTVTEEKSGVASENLFELEPDKSLRVLSLSSRKKSTKRRTSSEDQTDQQGREKRLTRQNKKNEGSKKERKQEKYQQIEHELSVDTGSTEDEVLSEISDLSNEPQPDTGDAYDKLAARAKSEKKSRRTSTPRGRKKKEQISNPQEESAADNKITSSEHTTNSKDDVEIVLDLRDIHLEKEETDSDFQLFAVDSGEQEELRQNRNSND